MNETADSATHYFQKSIDLCLTHEKYSNLAILYRNLSESYKMSGVHELALIAIEKSIPIKDSLMGIKQHEQIVKREKEQCQELHHELEIASAFSMKQYILIFSLIIILIISFFYQRFQKIKLLNLLLKGKKQTLQKQLLMNMKKLIVGLRENYMTTLEGQ